jgi:hypothetical protein
MAAKEQFEAKCTLVLLSPNQKKALAIAIFCIPHTVLHEVLLYSFSPARALHWRDIRHRSLELMDIH